MFLKAGLFIKRTYASRYSESVPILQCCLYEHLKGLLFHYYGWDDLKNTVGNDTSVSELKMKGGT